MRKLVASVLAGCLLVSAPMLSACSSNTEEAPQAEAETDVQEEEEVGTQTVECEYLALEIPADWEEHTATDGSTYWSSPDGNQIATFTDVLYNVSELRSDTQLSEAWQKAVPGIVANTNTWLTVGDGGDDDAHGFYAQVKDVIGEDDAQGYLLAIATGDCTQAAIVLVKNDYALDYKSSLYDMLLAVSIANDGAPNYKPADTGASATTTTETPAATDSSTEVTLGMSNALAKAQSYLRVSAFSYEGLIDQLEYAGFTSDEAKYAADNCGADWSAQALAKAKSYLDVSAFSYSGLIEQLEYTGFTSDQAKFGADNCGADWMEQAAKKAQSYMSVSSFSREKLIQQLEYTGFTHEQAEHGAAAVGY